MIPADFEDICIRERTAAAKVTGSWQPWVDDVEFLLARVAQLEGALERMRVVAQEFVESSEAFPGKPLGPKTKQRFADSFAAALAIARQALQEQSGE